MSTIALYTGLDLRELVTTGSVLHINEDHENVEHRIESEDVREGKGDILGAPVLSFEELTKNMTPVDEDGHVKKKILEEGGGLPLHNGCTVSVAYSGYFEGSLKPFDMTKCNRPLVINLQETGLLPGLEIAIRSMLVGEVSVFLLNYKLMYGELGIPPRIKPQADCIFYVNLIKSILSPEGPIDFSGKDLFKRIHIEVTQLYTSGVVLHKAQNFTAAVQLFRKGVSSLHKCRLSDEQEENIQQKLLKKLYLNLAVCYNKLKQPLKACISCNELNRLSSLWNNEKALYQNAKALRMISQFDAAEKRLQRALKLSPNNEDIQAEKKLLEKLRDTCNRTKLLEKRAPTIGEDFKEEVEGLIKNFKENHNLCKLTLPGSLNDCEIEYIKGVCEKKNLFCNKVQKNYLLDKNTESLPVETDIDIFL